jgi:hypothetical protein
MGDSASGRPSHWMDFPTATTNGTWSRRAVKKPENSDVLELLHELLQVRREMNPSKTYNTLRYMLGPVLLKSMLGRPWQF